jgi:predicted transcriptional regulator of viral defense system
MNSSTTSLYKAQVFTFTEAMGLVTMPTVSLKSMLTRLQKSGSAKKVRRGLYVMVDVATGGVLSTRYEIGSKISETSFIGYHSAFEFHGFAHQAFSQLFVGSDSRFSSFDFEDVRYEYCSNTIGNIGIYTPIGHPKVRVSTIERTIVDCCDRVDRVGGYEELSHCLESVLLLEENKLKQCLDAYNKKSLYQKVGYMMGGIQKQVHISDDFLAYCKRSSSGMISYFTKDSNVYVKEWGLYIPELKQENNALV